MEKVELEVGPELNATLWAQRVATPLRVFDREGLDGDKLREGLNKLARISGEGLINLQRLADDIRRIFHTSDSKSTLDNHSRSR